VEKLFHQWLPFTSETRRHGEPGKSGSEITAEEEDTEGWLADGAEALRRGGKTKSKPEAAEGWTMSCAIAGGVDSKHGDSFHPMAWQYSAANRRDSPRKMPGRREKTERAEVVEDMVGWMSRLNVPLPSSVSPCLGGESNFPAMPRSNGDGGNPPLKGLWSLRDLRF
jgi:hypothetical protein